MQGRVKPHPAVFILKHVPNEGAGTISDYLSQNKIPFVNANLYEGDGLPEAVDVRCAVIMGGPMNVYEEEKHPFLKEEDVFIRRLLDKNIPVLGICLGSQLIAKASGAKVMRAPVEEIGWDTVHLTAQALKDPLFSRVDGPALKVLQWHGDTFELPKNAVLLAESPAVKHQAYRLKDNVYGLQFHLEIDRPMLENWFKNREDRDLILKEYEAYKPKLAKITNHIYSNFFHFLNIFRKI